MQVTVFSYHAFTIGFVVRTDKDWSREASHQSCTCISFSNKYALFISLLFQAISNALLQEQQRASLLSSHVGEPARNAEQSTLKQASLLNNSRDVTSSLRRTMQRVSLEVERMSAAQHLLSADSKAIDGTLEKHSGYHSAAADNEAHLKDISRQEKIDQAILVLCIILFLIVVMYIIWKRTIGWFF